MIKRDTKSSDAAQKSVHSKKKKLNELFVDVFEKLTTVFNSSGELIRSEINGSLIAKSFLAGQPRLKIGLSENISIGRKGIYKNNYIYIMKVVMVQLF